MLTHAPFLWGVLLCTHSALFPQNPTSRHTRVAEVFQKARDSSFVIHIRDKRSLASLTISYLTDLDEEQSSAKTSFFSVAGFNTHFMFFPN